VQLLQTLISEVQKNTVKQSVFFAFLGSGRVKAARKMLLKSTTALQTSFLSIYSIDTTLWCLHPTNLKKENFISAAKKVGRLAM